MTLKNGFSLWLFIIYLKLSTSKLINKKIKGKKLSNIVLHSLGQIDLTEAKVAGYIRKAIDEFRKTDPKYLKQIDMVIFEQRMLGAFQNAFSGSGSSQKKVKAPKMPKSKPTTVPAGAAATFSISASVPPGPKVSVNVTQGDILTSNCEVMINTTGGDFDLTGIVRRKQGSVK